MLSRCSSKHAQGKIISLGCAASFVKSAPQFFHYVFSPAAAYIRLVIDGESVRVKPVQGRENIVCGTLKSQSTATNCICLIHPAWQQFSFQLHRLVSHLTRNTNLLFKL